MLIPKLKLSDIEPVCSPFDEKNSDKRDNLLKAIQILLSQTDARNSPDSAPSRIEPLFSNESARNAISFISKCLITEVVPDYEPFVSSNFEIFIYALISHFSAALKTMNFEGQTFSLDAIETDLDSDGIKVLFFKYGLYITIHLSQNSERFCRNMIKNGYFRPFLQILIDSELAQRNNDLNEHLLLIISHLSRFCDDLKHVWIKQDASQNILKLVKDNSIESVAAYTCIANLTIDNKLFQSEISVKLCEYMSRLLKDFSEAIRSAQPICRHLKFIFENQKRIECEVTCFNERNRVVTFFEVLDVFYRLSLSAELSEKLYFEMNLKGCLISIFATGNVNEILYVMRVVAQISFYDKIALDLSKDTQLMTIINKWICAFVSNIQSGESKPEDYFQLSVYNLCKQVKWNLHQSRKKSWKKYKQASKQTKKGQIFISYHRSSKRVSKSIKRHLETDGLETLMKTKGLDDMDDRYAIDLNSMSTQIDESSCMLMLVCEKYRQSVSCRAEAEYAVRMNIPIIYVTAQEGYSSAGGWIGDILRNESILEFHLMMNQEERQASLEKLCQVIRTLKGFPLKPVQSKIETVSSNKAEDSTGKKEGQYGINFHFDQFVLRNDLFR
jgi:hypothetical protein